MDARDDSTNQTGIVEAGSRGYGATERNAATAVGPACVVRSLNCVQTVTQSLYPCFLVHVVEVFRE